MIKHYSQFLLDKKKGETDAKLRYRIKWNGEIVAFSVGYRVDILKWSIDTQRCKLSTTHGIKKIAASVINKEIERFIKAEEKVFAYFEKEDRIPTAEEFRNFFNKEIGKKTKTAENGNSFFDVFDLFTKTMGDQNNWSHPTYVKFNAIKSHLTAFDPELSLRTISDATMQSFVAYLHKIKLRNTTIAKQLDLMRWFLRWAASNGHYEGKLHETFRAKLKGVDGNSKEVIHLTWDELMTLMEYKAPDNKKSLERVRDVFCFCCFTGLRHSDVYKLSRADVKDDHISFVTLKTTDALKVELNKYSRAILDKYKDCHFPKDQALPVISNAKMNDYLKELGELAGINAPQRIVYYMGNKRHEEVYPKYALLTTHAGRRTFVVIALQLGIPASVIMKYTGHSDFKAMKPYVKIVDDLKSQEMEKFNKQPDHNTIQDQIRYFFTTAIRKLVSIESIESMAEIPQNSLLEFLDNEKSVLDLIQVKNLLPVLKLIGFNYNEQ